MRSKNKKAAFEMSITTIVILVIALSMLIFGMIFVRNMMCSGMDIMTDVTKGTQKEIDSLFSTRGGEVVCLGEGNEVQDVYPSNELQKAFCAFNVVTSTSFHFTVHPEQATIVFKDPTSSLNDANVRAWLHSALPPDGNIGVIANSETLVPIIYMQIPKGTDQISFKVPFTVQKTGGIAENRMMTFQIKSVGAVQGAIC
jgi:hypothetical protein